MNPFRSRSPLLILVLIAVAVGAGSLLVAGSALADHALFRVQRTFLGAPFPPVTTPGGAGRSTGAVEPYKPYFKTITSEGATMGPGTGTTLPPGYAVVDPSNPIGGAFTIPQGVIDYQGTFTLYPSTAFTGYFSRSIVNYENFQGRFGPNNPNGATTPTTVTFLDNYAAGTTTFGGDFEFSRNGYLKIDPGPNQFGGTMKYLYRESSSFYQYISYFNPLFFKGYGSFGCTKNGVDCTNGLETELGEATSSGMVSRFLLAPTVFTYPTPTVNGKSKYRKISDPPVISKNYYLHLNAPWTTGTVSAFNDKGVTSGYAVHPVSTGYDKILATNGTDITLTRTYTAVEYKGKGKTYYPTQKYYTKLTGVTRVVSLVKPRLTHSYQVPRIPADPLFMAYQANRVWVMKVFFLPEPTGVLMLGSGIAVLLGLSRIRRRR